MKLDELIEVLRHYEPPPGHRIDAVYVITDHSLMLTTSADGENRQHDSLTQEWAHGAPPRRVTEWTIERGAA